MRKNNKYGVSAVRHKALPKKQISKTVLFRVVLFFVLVGAGFMDTQWITSLHVFPVKKIRIEGEFKQIDNALLKQRIESFSIGGFFDLDIVSLRRELLDEQWVEDAYVRREWPGTVIIRVVEKKPVARWNSSGVLTASGQLFFPKKILGTEFLVDLHGPKNRHKYVLSEFNKIQSMLHQSGINIDKLVQNERRSWQMEIAGVIINLGRKDIYIKIEKIVGVYAALLEPKLNMILKIDFRYTNGFSVKWKDGVAKKINKENTGVASMHTRKESNFFMGAVSNV